MPKSKSFLDKLIHPFIARNGKGSREEDDLESIAARERKLFRYSDLSAATRNFSPKNKLGEGGFGPVYKGVLEDGREVAVKKLSSRSRQGAKEFKNEAMLLSKVQHKNIVNLYGYCAVGEDENSGGCEQKLLVYEYVPRESLDKYLFHEGKKEELNWKKRFDIIIAVARGLLYLHEDAHTTIIHRDIKAANILLDDHWVPKIADFGMARLYPEDQTHVNTRVAGTNGYMAPEYVMHGQLSTKADVFSFGVLTLELISGHKNSTFLHQSDGRSLLEWAWILHNKGQILEILDAVLKSTAPEDQVAMCAHVGLLCTQADPKARPDMRRVVVMLSKNSSSLPPPMKPGFPGSRYRRNATASTSGYTGESSSHAAIASGSTSGSSSSRNASTFASNTRSDSNSRSTSNTQSTSTATKRRSGIIIHERHTETI